MNSKQIKTDRIRYSNQLAEAERQVAALRDMLAALDRLEGNVPQQATLPLSAPMKSKPARLKLTPAIRQVFENTPGVPLGPGDVREALARMGLDMKAKRLPIKIARTLKRLVKQGEIDGVKINGRWSYGKHTAQPLRFA